MGISIPKGVFLRTFSRRRSPELMEARSGNLVRSRSVCVPFPTPGAPIRMIRAAFLSGRIARVIVVCLFFCLGEGRRRRSIQVGRYYRARNARLTNPRAFERHFGLLRIVEPSNLFKTGTDNGKAVRYMMSMMVVIDT